MDNIKYLHEVEEDFRNIGYRRINSEQKRKLFKQKYILNCI